MQSLTPDTSDRNPKLRAALSYAAHGWPVFPLVPGDKVPLIPKDEGGRGACDATTDERQIRQWWAQCPNANVAGTLPSLLVIDIDPRNGGDETWTRLCLQHGEPTTLTQLTGSGGLHYVFRRPDFEPRGKLDRGIDVKHGAGQYIVIAPSVHPCGGRYRWIVRMAPQPLPEWLAALLRKSEPIAYRPPTPEARRDRPDAYERAARYLEHTPPAISGQGGHVATFTTALKLVTRYPELGESDLLELLACWNQRCEPPWSRTDLEHKLCEALRSARRGAA
jgi:hypothetical protein